jgi:threonine aldolase
MLFFMNDYGEGMHPEVLAALTRTNMEQLPGYGTDMYCARAAEKIKAAAGCPAGDVFFISGGTQTNQLVIDAMLALYEGVVAAETGHVNVHESGAIEHGGHKVLTLPSHNGKIQAEDLDRYMRIFSRDANKDQMVQPGMVYISYPTEYGTLYSKPELEAIRAVCTRYELKLFIDGARLGYGLACDEADMTLADIASLCDVFYIGGTKVGAICGEAVVFPRGNTPKHFTTTIKQHGAMLAKGRLLGVQFDALFTDNLYFRIARNAIDRAAEIKRDLADKGYRFYLDSPTNQIFVIWPNADLETLGKKVAYGFWETYDDEHTVIRFATSWATAKESVEALKALL